MTVKKSREMLIEPRVHKKKQRNSQSHLRPAPPKFFNNDIHNHRAQPSQHKRDHMPINRDLRDDAGCELIDIPPQWTARCKIFRKRCGPQLITDPRDRQIVPIKAQLRNQQSIRKDGNEKKRDGWTQIFLHKRLLHGTDIQTLDLAQRIASLWTFDCLCFDTAPQPTKQRPDIIL